jgi:hypothetical protein
MLDSNGLAAATSCRCEPTGDILSPPASLVLVLTCSLKSDQE